MGAPADDAGLTRDVRAASAALGDLVPHAASLGPGVAEAIQQVCEAVEPALGKSEVVLAVVGEPAARRAILRHVLGENVVRAPAARRERVTRVRTAESYDYVAREKNGKAIRFARVMPDRDALYQQSLEDAEREVEEARSARAELENDVQRSRQAVRAIEVEILALDEEVEAAGQAFAVAWRAEKAANTTLAAIEQAAPQIPPIFMKAPPWWALWLWFLRWMLRRKWRDQVAAWERNRADAASGRARVADLGEEARGREAARDGVRARRSGHNSILSHAQSVLANAEVALADEVAVKKAEAKVETLLRERARHAVERKEEFFSDLREIDGANRGDEVEELEVDYPADHPGAPPPGLVLAFAASPPSDADGFVVAQLGAGPASKAPAAPKATADSKAPPGPKAPADSKAPAAPKDATDDAYRLKLPRAAVLVARPGGPGPNAALSRLAGHKLVPATRLAIALRACIADVSRAREAAEVEHQRRLGALESQRIPHPDDFREKQVARSEPSIVKGAAEVVAAARKKLEDGVEELAKEWTERLATARGKRGIEACVHDINRRGKMRVLELLEAVSELVAREMQEVGESLERWALDEIQTSYRTQKKVRPESLIPVVSEITGEDLAREVAPRVPVPTALATFRGKRVRVALAGAAVLGGAGAGASTLAPGHLHLAAFGAAGLVLGIASAWLTPTKSLRADCLASVQQYAAEVARTGTALLDGKLGDVEAGIRTALDAALADTLERLNDAITRLMTIERNAIDAERATLARLASTHATLDEHAARLAQRIAEAEAFFRATS